MSFAELYEDMLGYDDPNYSSPRVKKGSNKLLAEERLTYKSNVAPMCFIDQITGNVKEPHELHAQEICVALNKLAKYEDAEEQGLLLKLP